MSRYKGDIKGMSLKSTAFVFKSILAEMAEIEYSKLNWFLGELPSFLFFLILAN